MQIKQNTFIDYDILKELYENDCDCDYKELLNRVYDLVNYQNCVIDWDAFTDIITDATCIANCKQLNIEYNNNNKKYYLTAFNKNINIDDLMQVQDIKELKENVLYNFNETEQNAVIDDLKFLLDDTEFIDLLTLINNIEFFNYPTANIYCNTDFKLKYFSFREEEEKMQESDMQENNKNDSEIIEKLLNLINDLSPEIKEKIKNSIN